MWYLTQQYWFWLLAALALGLVIGWLTFAPRLAGWWTGWMPAAAIAFALGLVLAIFRLIPGKAGLWLDTALLFFATYIAGCFLGSWLYGLLGRPEPAPLMAFAGQGAAVPAPAPAMPAAAAPMEPAAKVAPKAKPAPAKSASAEPAPAKAAVKAEKAPVVPAAAVPEPAPRIEGEEKIAGARPAGLKLARGGKPDDLKLIKGIGKQNEGRLHGLGIWHFDQISAWTKQNVLWVGSYLAFPGRIEREEWVKQARQLAAGKETAFSKRAKWGLVATSKDDGSLGQGNVEKPNGKGKP